MRSSRRVRLIPLRRSYLASRDARAAMAGLSLSDYLLAEIREVAERPTLTELRARMHQRKPLAVPLDTARLVREERDSR